MPSARDLVAKLAQIICVSQYIKDCFLDGLALDAEDLAKVCVFPIGVSRRLKTPPQKEAIIFLAGRMVPEKGILECAQALADILPSYPEWRLVIAGARRFEQADPNSYEAKVAKAIEPLGNQAEMTGFIPLDQVRDWQERAAIAACPSLWQEPLGKVVVEALAAGCAVLTTRRGGIPEVAEGRALIIDKPSVATFRDGFAKLLKMISSVINCKASPLQIFRLPAPQWPIRWMRFAKQHLTRLGMDIDGKTG